MLYYVNPGVEAHTHEFIQTGQEDSKFGLSIKHGLALNAVNKVKATKHLQLKGIHFHIGSQIEGTEAMIKTAKIVLNWLASERIEVSLLNIGGGFGIKYVEGDESFLLSKEYLKLLKLLKKLRKHCSTIFLKLG